MLKLAQLLLISALAFSPVVAIANSAVIYITAEVLDPESERGKALVAKLAEEEKQNQRKNISAKLPNLEQKNATNNQHKGEKSSTGSSDSKLLDKKSAE
ncbi:hypothetical protein [Serratia microhaemolytica]|uniref:hypothetical protein n=1 Tax=Serratia microhaemolytica TaxID=2675110 RepID=UPI000FDEC4CE|nr:hypothetical protein [Serratia microhaemolytica]